MNPRMGSPGMGLQHFANCTASPSDPWMTIEPAGAVLELGSERHELVVDFRRGATVADVGVHRVGKIHRGRAARHRHDLALGGEHVDLVRKEVDLDVLQEFGGIARGVLDVEQRLQPFVGALLHFVDLGVGALVQPVRSHAGVGDAVHRLRADLDFDRHAVRADQGGVQRLIAVDLGDRDVVLEFSGHGLVQAVQGAEREIAAGDVLDHDPEAVDVEHLRERQVLDIYGFRVVVKDVPGCYLALGALHGLYKPVPGKFKDYIAIPKVNGYQSLHTTLIGPYGMPVEVQIRTQAMNRIADAGVASHWLYKSSDAEINKVQQRTHKWLQSLLDIQHASGDPAEFLEHIKVDLFPDEVYVFTPKGKIMAMPRGATAVDFAYAVHTDIGNRCAAARINYELAPLRTELKNGDRVEIITAAHAHPNPAWLSYVKTGKARSQIRHFLKTMQYEEAASLGERMLNQAVRALGVKPSEANSDRWERLVRDLGAKSRQEVVADIGLGKRLAAIVARKLLSLSEPHQSEGKAPPGSIVIHGSEGLAVPFAKCCNPIPGDPITRFIKKGQGLVVHTHDCPTAAKSRGDPEKWLDV